MQLNKPFCYCNGGLKLMFYPAGRANDVDLFTFSKPSSSFFKNMILQTSKYFFKYVYFY